MTRIAIDAAMSLDGISFDKCGASVFPIDEMHESGLVDGIALRTGAVVMNRHSFEMAADPDWYADNYELQVPIVVITDDPPARRPKENDHLSFEFVSNLSVALQTARAHAGVRDVMLIGEPGLVQNALDADAVDELYIRITPRLVGEGTPLFDGQAPAKFLPRGRQPFGYRHASSPRQNESMTHMTNKITTCLWFDGQAEEAANFYQSTFPDSHVHGVYRAPADFPGGKEGDVLTVEFSVLGMAFLGMNGGPQFKFDEAVSFIVSTEDQAETDRYWNAIIDNGGSASECGWCKDKYGLSWQITPRRLTELFNGGGERGKAAFEAMMTMSKIDIAKLDAAAAGAKADA